MQAAMGVLAGLALTLLLVRVRVPMGIGFLAGSVVMGLLAGLGPGGTGEALGACVTAGDTWLFVAVVMLVFALSAALRLAGSLDLLVEASKGLIRNHRLRLASLPALVGLLPMPGGAVVSAPMVEKSGSPNGLDARQKNLVNYWFRHVWEVFWPLYPAILLAASILGSPVALLSALQLPLGILLVLLGWLFILRSLPEERESGSHPPIPGRHVLLALLPLAVVVMGMPALGWSLAGLMSDGAAGQAGLLLALLLGLGVIACLHGPAPVGGAFRERRTWSLLALAIGVKVFGAMVISSGAATSTAHVILDGGVPALAAAVVLPMFIGLVSGNTLVIVTVAFPVLFALNGGDHEPWTALLPTFVLAYAMGFVGYMLSPVHLCLVLSSRFFGEPVTRAYARIFWPLLIFAGGAAAAWAVLAQLVP